MNTTAGPADNHVWPLNMREKTVELTVFQKIFFIPFAVTKMGRHQVLPTLLLCDTKPGDEGTFSTPSCECAILFRRLG